MEPAEDGAQAAPQVCPRQRPRQGGEHQAWECGWGDCGEHHLITGSRASGPGVWMGRLWGPSPDPREQGVRAGSVDGELQGAVT